MSVLTADERQQLDADGYLPLTRIVEPGRVRAMSVFVRRRDSC